MKRFAEYLKNWKKNRLYIYEEDYKISEGCCLFHDRSELRNFDDINDDDSPNII